MLAIHRGTEVIEAESSTLSQEDWAGNSSAIRPFSFRKPTVEDGAGIWKLIDGCKPLDLNSRYAYLLLCRHFAETCVVGESLGETVAFLSAYLPPRCTETVFVWQVAVREDFRGQGTASKMLRELLTRVACRDRRFLETTVTPSNQASLALFNRFAEKLDKPCVVVDSFPSSLFGDESHETEQFLRIGPFDPNKLKEKES